jgi:hypothetical protein
MSKSQRVAKAMDQLSETRAMRERICEALLRNHMGNGRIMLHAIEAFGGKLVIMYRVETSTYIHNRCVIILVNGETMHVENNVIVSQESMR